MSLRFLFAISLWTASACAATTGTMSAEKLKTACDVWVAVGDRQSWSDDVNERLQQIKSSMICAAFIDGLSNEMIGELSWMDDTHKRVVVGALADGVTVKQEILVFVDYLNANPALLNKPATQVFRKAMEAADLYTYATP